MKMRVSAGTGSATCCRASPYVWKDLSEGNERRPLARDDVTLRPSSKRTMSCWMAASATSIALADCGMSISASFVGNFADLKRYSGARNTKCASPGSTVTKAFITASSLNSWPRAGTQQHANNAAIRRKTKGVRRCIMVHASVGGRRRAIRKMYMHGPHARHELYCASENGRERTASPAAILEASVAVPLTVALAVAVVALDMQELLDAASVDRLAGVDVTLRVDRVAMQERELRTAIMPRFAQVGDDRTARPFHGVHDLVATIDLEEVRLGRIVGEAQIPRRARGPEPWRAWGGGPGGTDCAVIAQGHTGTRDDRNDAHQVGERLVEHLDPVVAPIARVDVAVVTTHDAVRMATIARREESREVSQWIVYRCRHWIVDLRPLPEPRHGAVVVVLEHHHPVVAV